MQQQVSLLWKVAAATLALVPGLYSIIFYMVEAKTDNLTQRVKHVEQELSKGPRFTAHDGELLKAKVHQVEEHHHQDAKTIGTLLDKIRFDDATCKANMGALQQRFNRLEDRVYSTDTLQQDGHFRNAPYMKPNEEYDHFQLTRSLD
jgi:hypothetical protein